MSDARVNDDRTLTDTRLMTAARMAADGLLVPVWPPLGASAAERTVSDGGIRYLLLLPRLDLRVEIRTTTFEESAVLLTLDARPRGILRRTTATLVRPLDGGFESIASEVIVEPSIESLESALFRCRTALWNHPSFGQDAVGLRRVA